MALPALLVSLEAAQLDGSTVRAAPNEATEDIVVDESCFPLVFTVLPAFVDQASVERYFKRFEGVLQRGKPFVSIADASAVRDRPPATVRKQLADWTRSVDARLTLLSKGDARIVQSAIIRGAMTAIGWLHQTRVPQEWFTCREDAIVWALAKLDHADVDIPRHVRERLVSRITR